jgi:hypothetical protein
MDRSLTPIMSSFVLLATAVLYGQQSPQTELTKEQIKGSSGTTMRKFTADASCCALMGWQISQQGQTSPHGLPGSSV